MLRETKEKIALYAGYITIMCITFLGYDGMGIFEGCSIQNRLSYPFFHQNIFHAAINLYVFHQCYRAIPCGIGHTGGILSHSHQLSLHLIHTYHRSQRLYLCLHGLHRPLRGE